MEYENNEIKKVGSSNNSFYQVHELLSSKILSRQSTVGSCSYRFFSGPSEGVPFQWETTPGKPIKPPQDDILPPLSPPPAVLAMGLPKPCFDVEDKPKAKKWSKAWLVKKIKKTIYGYHNKVIVGHNTSRRISLGEKQHGNKIESQRYDYSESTRYSSISYTSSLSSSSTNSYSDEKTSSKDFDVQNKALLQGKPFVCNPRGFSDIIVYFMKKSR